MNWNWANGMAKYSIKANSNTLLKCSETSLNF